MEPLFGLDYAWGDPGIPALKKAGVKFVCRYLSWVGNTKNLREGEALVLRANGIAVVTVFESYAARALKGLSGGIQDARAAREQLELLDAPSDAPVYFAVDFDAYESQQPTLNAYLKGAASVLGKNRVGVYGGYYVVKRCLDAKVCKYAWQTYAWSGGQWDRRAHLQQYRNGQRLNGVSVDYNRAMFPDFGQWDGGVEQIAYHPKPRVKWVRAWVPKWVATKWAKRRKKPGTPA